MAGFSGISMALFIIILLKILKSNTYKKDDYNKIKSLLYNNLLELFLLKKQ